MPRAEPTRGLRDPTQGDAQRWSACSVGVALLAICIAIILATGETVAQRSADVPEAATARLDPRVPASRVTSRHMVVAANAHAAAAGREILRAGGSAVDAAIAVQLVLGLVEPQSSGLGGGAFLLSWDAAARELTTYDGRETAPAAAKAERFIRDGRPLPFTAAMRSGLAVGTPGAVRLLEAVHGKHGKLAWAELFAPAIQLAEKGFAVSPRLNALLAGDGPARFSGAARTYFFDAEGKPRPVGHVLRNPSYAAVLRAVAAGGAEAFYAGRIAEAIVAAVATAAAHPGDLTLADLAGYRVQQRPPVCMPYRGHRVCSMGPPSSGGIAVAQALMLLEGFDLGRSPAAALNPGAVHLMAEALRLAFADRNHYVADSDFTAVPEGLLDPDYLAERRRLIDPSRTLAHAAHGTPPGRRRAAVGLDDTIEMAGTSHLSIVDAHGNAVAMTTTIEAGFGSGLWAEGFLLNNQMTDFSFRGRDSEGRPIANRIEPGKRPRSSMTPVMVFDEAGQLLLVTGSPGGSRIIPYVLKALVATLDWKLGPQAAIELPNISSTSAMIEIEGPALTWRNLRLRSAEAYRGLRLAIELAPLGRRAGFMEMSSGTHTIQRLPDGRLEGGADPRREGVVVGD